MREAALASPPYAGPFVPKMWRTVGRGIPSQPGWFGPLIPMTPRPPMAGPIRPAWASKVAAARERNRDLVDPRDALVKMGSVPVALR